MKISILVFPGINRERDMAHAVKQVCGRAPTMVWHGEREIPASDVIVIPGGFSYGDYLRPGAIAARSPIVADLIRKADAGVTVLGICNGFQVLTETGLLPGALMRNAGLTFICKDVHLRVETADTRFTSRYEAGQVIRVPVAHHDGNYFADPDTLARLEGEGRVMFRYCDESGATTLEANPNGSINNIAGVLNAKRNVMGTMPHPENLIDPLFGGADGLGLFESLLERAA
jgi:phosphoribosylformylglycinamidine synthase